jgi:hypothetical protein
MADVRIELKQEGVIRAEGYQVTQWVTTLASATDPASYASLFVLRKTAGAESFERVATMRDLVAYPANELKYFDAKKAGGDAILSALPGDILTINPALDYWLQAGAPYADCQFFVDGVEVLSEGLAPLALPGNRVQLPGATLTADDVGRWVTLSGFATAAYNGPAQILAYAGSTATVSTVISTPDTGSVWQFRRVRIATDVGAGFEPRYFPTLESNLHWTLTRGGTTIAAGAFGATSRQDPTLALYRARRVTTVELTLDAATALMSVVQNAVSLLQGAAAQNGASFSGVQTYDFPPTS